MKKIVYNFLAQCARAVLQREKPKIIAVTGSVGKTSTRDAIAVVLGKTFFVRASRKNYNNEIGVPLTVLGLASAGKNPLAWAVIFYRALSRSWVRAREKYPDVLVLEMGADRPGDIAHLVDIACPDIAVVTAVGEAHLEFFGSIDDIAREKSELVRHVSANGVAVLNRDDERVWAMHHQAPQGTQLISFGFDASADVRCLEESIHYADHGDSFAMHFSFSYRGEQHAVQLTANIGRQSIYALLAAAAVGFALHMDSGDITEQLSTYIGPPGRMRCLQGIKRTLIIDDTYNAAAPRSTLAAIETLRDIPSRQQGKKIAVLGDMRELGTLSESVHRAVGEAVAKSGIDELIVVGPMMQFAHQAAIAAGMSENAVFHFGSIVEAGKFVQERMRANDIIVVKGSQGMRMEKIVKEIMADPEKAALLLVRQDGGWQ